MSIMIIMIMILAKMIRFQSVGGKPGVALGKLISFGAHHLDLGENCMSLFSERFAMVKLLMYNIKIKFS